MVFDLETDPHEERDLAPKRGDICREGAWRLARWHDAQMQKMALNSSDVVDPLWTVMREDGPFHANPRENRAGFQRYLARLEATGRKAGAETLRAKYRRYLPAST